MLVVNMEEHITVMVLAVVVSRHCLLVMVHNAIVAHAAVEVQSNAMAYAQDLILRLLTLTSLVEFAEQ